MSITYAQHRFELIIMLFLATAKIVLQQLFQDATV